MDTLHKGDNDDDNNNNNNNNNNHNALQTKYHATKYYKQKPTANADYVNNLIRQSNM